MSRLKTTLAGHAWRIKRVKGLRDEADNELYGSCDSRNRVIELCKGMDPNREWETVLHEMVHAVEKEYGLKLSEQKVEILGKGLREMLAPWLRSLRP